MRQFMGDASTLLTFIIFAGIGAWMIAQGVYLGWLVIVFSSGAGIYWAHMMTQQMLRERRTRKWRIQQKNEAAQRVAIAGEFAFEDDAEFWEELWRDKINSWVVFENGTCVICVDDQNPEAEAVAAMARYASEDNACGDFSVAFKSEMAAFLISYPCRRVFNYIEALGGSENAAGMIARATRNEDAKTLNIVHIHGKA